MKLTKLLAPALTIAGASAIVVPVVTSCATNYGGIEVTEAQWTEATTYFDEITTSTDFTCKMSMTMEGETVSGTYKVTDGKEAEIVDSETTFYKNGTSPQIYNSTSKEWEVCEEEELPSNSIAVIVKQVKGFTFSELKFEHGAYTYTEDGNTMIIAIKKFGDNYRIGYIEASGEASSTHVVVKIELSAYGSTTISDFPA